MDKRKIPKGNEKDVINDELEGTNKTPSSLKKRCKQHREKEQRRRQKGKAPRIPVWIKEETLNYEEELRQLQIELLKFQNYVKENGLKVLILFEGRDAAGKGGIIKRITEHLNPRGARVVALEKPSDTEKTQWYFQRYVEHLPSAGEIVLFDRSWYNRAGVENVMGFCTQREVTSFLKEVPAFEKMLVDSDIILFKFYFSISKKEQGKRFKRRKTDPLKQYKLSPVDQKAQDLWDEYTMAEYEMFRASHTSHSPWTVIETDDKKTARINAIRHFLNYVDYPDKIPQEKIKVDKNVVIFGSDKHINMRKTHILKRKKEKKHA